MCRTDERITGLQIYKLEINTTFIMFLCIHSCFSEMNYQTLEVKSNSLQGRSWDFKKMFLFKQGGYNPYEISAFSRSCSFATYDEKRDTQLLKDYTIDKIICFAVYIFIKSFDELVQFLKLGKWKILNALHIQYNLNILISFL